MARLNRANVVFAIVAAAVATGAYFAYDLIRFTRAYEPLEPFLGKCALNGLPVKNGKVLQSATAFVVAWNDGSTLICGRQNHVIGFLGRSGRIEKGGVPYLVKDWSLTKSPDYVLSYSASSDELKISVEKAK